MSPFLNKHAPFITKHLAYALLLVGIPLYYSIKCKLRLLESNVFKDNKCT